MEQLSLLPFVTLLCKITCWINSLQWCEAKVYSFIFSSSFSYDLYCHLQIIYFLFDNFCGFLFLSFLFFVSSLKTLAFLLALFWLCHKILGPDFYFSCFAYLSNTNRKRKYAYLKGENLNIMITFQKAVYFKVKNTSCVLAASNNIWVCLH